MLKRMVVNRFTAFGCVDLGLAPHLNIFAGENGSGKSHLLKLAYSLMRVGFDGGVKSRLGTPTKGYLEGAYGDKLFHVFRPEKLGYLVRRGSSDCDVLLNFEDAALDVGVRFAANARENVNVVNVPLAWQGVRPVYLPARELVTIFPNFASLYEGYHVEFEETWFDACMGLGALLRRDLSKEWVDTFISPLEGVLGGTVVLGENGHFYLKSGSDKIGMSLLGEGHRKLVMLVRLLANGGIKEGCSLFLDEPDAGLSSDLVSVLAKVLYDLGRFGVQVFLSTHSMFLLGELHRLSGDSGVVHWLHSGTPT